MNIQLLSDLHLESELFDPEPLPQADVLVLAGDIDSTWAALDRFAGWPVPVLFVAGNHEFDGRELDAAWPALRERCARNGLTLLERESVVLGAPDGRRIRFVGSVRWCDFEVFGAGRRAAALRAGAYFQRVMGATLHGRTFDAEAVRSEALACRDWLKQAFSADGDWHTTVAITHFAPTLTSADPRYGHRNGTASFCNADDDLLPGAALWLHGHLHCRHDYLVSHASGRTTRIVSQALGLADKGEPEGYDAAKLIAV